MNCQICFENYNGNTNQPLVIIPCGHSFCKFCLENLNDSVCPKCRRDITEKVLNYAILDVLDLNLVPDLNASLKNSIKKC